MFLSNAHHIKVEGSDGRRLSSWNFFEKFIECYFVTDRFNKEIILRKIMIPTLMTYRQRRCFVVEDLARIHGESLVTSETKEGGTCTCALTPKTGGKQGECEIFGRELT